MQKITFHTFTMGDVEDPYLYASFPINEWQQTEHGKWCMDHTVGEPEFCCQPDPINYGFRILITGRLDDKDATYFKLKWGK